MIQHRFGPGPVTDLGFLPDGRLVVGLEQDPDLWLWDAARGDVGRFGFRRQARGTVTSLAVAPGRPWLAVQHSTTGLSVWDVAESKRLLRAAGYTPRGALAFSADGALLAAVANGFWRARSEVRLWDLTSGGSCRGSAGAAGSCGRWPSRRTGRPW
ncbi:MAG TPA: WD40 repeat domain-containing protein [Gemmataceae bacterium]